MKRALIATLFNEADNVARWWEQLMAQTVRPDEIIIVDGGSTDSTWEKLQQLAKQSPVPVKLEQRRCNISEGRNRAIALTDAEIIAATDAGSFLEPQWFDEITRPLLEDASVDVTGGTNISNETNDFLKFLAIVDRPEPEADMSRGQLHPSSRNTAFRRQAWTDVGGYPEWLTLAGEDALFTQELHLIGKKFLRCPKAVVHWTVRENEAAYFKLLARNGYGSAEACIHAPYFLRRGLISLFPPLLLLSRHRFHHLRFRYLKNFSSARGWVAGKLWGRRPPPDWRMIDGVWLSPEGQRHLKR